MVEIERKTFTVTTTGIGRPDYSPKIAASKLILDPLQTRFSETYEYEIQSSNMTNVQIYTIPTGYKLTLGSLIVTCDSSILQRLFLYRELNGTNRTYILRRYVFDTRAEIIWGAQSAVDIPAGWTLEMDIYNSDNKTCIFGIIIGGFVERVE